MTQSTTTEKSKGPKSSGAKTVVTKRTKTKKTAGQSSPRSREARRVATAILQVLGGARTVTDAASALGVSPPRYYQLESRALEGLVTACEPRVRGPRVTPERECARLQKEVGRLERELGRQQALARAAGRAVGLSAAKPERRSSGGSAKVRRRRKPAARALRAARRLQSTSNPEDVRATDGGAEAEASTAAAAS